MSINYQIDLKIRTEDKNSVFDSLDSPMDVLEVFKSWAEKGSCCFVASDPFGHNDVYDYFQRHDLKLSFVNSDLFFNYFSEFMLSNWSVIVICIDDFSGVGRIFKTLRTIRNDYPEASVILVSNEFKVNDLSKERLAICDISLHLPYEASSLPEAFVSAYQNNKVWIERLESLRRASDPRSKMTEKRRRRIKYSGNMRFDQLNVEEVNRLTNSAFFA